MTFRSTSSRIARRPRAPVPRSIDCSDDCLERIVGEVELDTVELEELLVLADECVLRLGQDLHERLVVEVVHVGDDRQTPDELGDQPVLQQVLGQHVLEDVADVLLFHLADVGTEADALAADAVLDDLLEAGECTTTDEQDVRRVDLDELLVRVLAPTLRRNALRSCPRGSSAELAAHLRPIHRG